MIIGNYLTLKNNKAQKPSMFETLIFYTIFTFSLSSAFFAGYCVCKETIMKKLNLKRNQREKTILGS